jgi:hypothetical protein
MRIPVYERQIERGGQGPALHSLPGERTSPMRIPSGAAQYEGLQEAAERVTRIGAKIKEAERVEEYSRALVNANEGMSRILQEMNEDPALAEAPPDEYEKRFGERSAELKQGIAAGMRDAEARDAFNLRFDDKAVDGRIKVRALGRDRMISRGRTSTDAQLDSLVNTMVRTGDVNALSEGESIIAGKVAAGFFSPEEGGQLRQRFLRSATAGYWERRILDAPALAYEMLRQNPESTRHLEETDRTRLLAAAKGAAEKHERDTTRNSAYAELKTRFGKNLQAAVDHLEDPRNYRDMDLDDRRYLIATFDAEITRDRERANQVRVESARAERRQVVDLMRKGDYDKAVELASGSENLPGEFVEHVYSVARRGKNADVTDPQVYTSLIEGIHKGTVTGPEQIDAYRLRGLSNDDADKLAGKVDKPERRGYKEAIDYAEAKFKALYPAKDDKEKHLKWFEFVNFVDRELDSAEKDKGRRLTHEEARRIVDSWIDPQLEEVDWWFDKTRVPFFDRPSARTDGPGRMLRGIPPEAVKGIERRLVGLNLPVSEENIRQYWMNNQTEFVKAGR